jgi:hypothetical protein
MLERDPVLAALSETELSLKRRLTIKAVSILERLLAMRVAEAEALENEKLLRDIAAARAARAAA